MTERNIERIFFVATSVMTFIIAYALVNAAFNIAWWFGVMMVVLLPSVFILIIYEVLRW